MILRGAKRNRLGAVREHEDRNFRARQALFDDEPRARRAESPLEHRFAYGLLGLRPIARDDDPFAAGEAVGFDDDGKSEIAAGHGVERGLDRVTDAKPRGGNAVPRHELLREGLRALERGGRRGRTDDRPAGAPE